MDEIAPVARALWTGRSYAQETDTDHFSRFRSHSTVMMRVHTMRSVVQAEVTNGNVPGFTLVDDYLGFGKVEVVCSNTDQHFLLKARSSLPFQITGQGVLFRSGQPAGANPLELLLYNFVPNGLELATIAADQQQINKKRRIVLLDEQVTELGVWTPDGGSDAPAFDQGDSDDFGDLSDGIEIERRRDL